MRHHLLVLAIILSICSALENEQNIEEGGRDKRLLSLFNVVTFSNAVCSGTNRNGTCYTSEECTNLGGSNDGSCASGYGVCCVFTLSCGGSSSQNCTYIEQSAATSISPNPCQYTISKCAASVCRIRLDFTTFSIEGPATSTDGTITTTGGAIGDCIGDTFTVTSPGQIAPPLICGENTGQHMYLDASDLAHILSFALSSSTSVSRSWTIKVTQYACNDIQGGPEGCLQYFTGATGSFASFNFPTSAAAIPLDATHLSNQKYSMCFRRESSSCAICFLPVLDTATPASFGISKSIVGSGADPKSGTDTECTEDHLGIANGVSAAIAVIAQPGQDAGITRICGRHFNPAPNLDTNLSICTRTRPFRLNFFADADEETALASMAEKHEVFGAPSGTIGFNLAFKQLSC